MTYKKVSHYQNHLKTFANVLCRADEHHELHTLYCIGKRFQSLAFTHMNFTEYLFWVWATLFCYNGNTSLQGLGVGLREYFMGLLWSQALMLGETARLPISASNPSQRESIRLTSAKVLYANLVYTT